MSTVKRKEPALESSALHQQTHDKFVDNTGTTNDRDQGMWFVVGW